MKNLLGIISLVLTTVVIIGGIAIGYGILQEKTNKTETIVTNHSMRINTTEKLDVKQSILIEHATQNLERNTQLIKKLEAKF